MDRVVEEEIGLAVRRRSATARLLGGIGRFITHKPLGAIGAVLIVTLIIVAVFAPIIAPYPPKALVARSLAAPGPQFIFGGDQIGRDVFSRVVWGARLSLYIGIVAVSLGSISGLVFGILTGYLGGWLDILGQRLIDSLMAFPGLILALGLMTALGASVNNVAIAIAIGIFPSSSRTIRSQTLSIKGNAYVEAARAIGCSPLRIMFFHILPQTLAPYLVLISL